MLGRIRARRFTVCAAVGALALAGCTGQSAPPPPEPSPAADTSQPRKYVPPVQFDRAGAVPLPETVASGVDKRTRPVALHGRTAYLMTSGALLVVDTRTGRQLSAIRPQHQPKPVYDFGGTVAAAPVITKVQGTTLALATFVVKVPGHGTTPGHEAVELVAVDTATHTPAWRMTMPNAESYRDQLAQVVGVQDTTAIVNVAPPGNQTGSGTVHAVDLSTRTVRWTHEKTQALALTGNHVIGVVPEGSMHQRLTAWSVQEGRTRWQTMSGRTMQVQDAGDSLLAASGVNYDTSEPFFALIEAANGVPVDRSDGHLAAAHCTFDQVSILVCSRGTRTQTDQVFAFDVNTRQLLWQLPAQGRIAPNVTTAWHGAVYGNTDSGPVVLDARTGTDRNAQPGAAPVVVNGVTGIAETPQGALVAYPTSG